MMPNSFTIVAPSPEMAKKLRDIAVILGATIVNEKIQESKMGKVEPLAREVVCHMYGLKPDDISSDVRTDDIFQARLLYANLLLHYGSNVRNIQRYLRKSDCTVRKYLNFHLMNYNQDVEYSRRFNVCLNFVNQQLL